MQAREKNLAIALGSVVGVMAVWMILKPWYFGPIEQEEAQLALVQSELDQLEHQQLQLLNATRNLADWKSRSLPPDPKPTGRQRPNALNGQRLYQEWLTDLARHCGFSNPEISPSITRAVQDVYVTAQVSVKAQATYGQLCQFLSLFEQTDLLHRIDKCEIVSSNHRGDPLLDLNLTAEAVALQSAPERDLLFPRTELASALAATDAKLTVKDSNGFPKSGRFGIQIANELLTVTHVKDTAWQISRGRDRTTPAAHPAGRKLDLGLYDPLSSEGSAKAPHPRLALIAEENPFTIPPPKPDGSRPYLELPRELTVYLGNRLELDVRAEGFNPTLGPPTFQFAGDVPAGMRIEPVQDRPFRGLITWQPEEEALIDTYTIPIQVTREDLLEPLTRSVRVRVRQRNFPPQIETPGSQIVYSGQPLTFTVNATDANENQRLTFSLGSTAPPEARIDPRTGRFDWTPPGVVMEQFLEIEVIVTDNGNPPESASVKVPVAVKADVAHFTRFVGSLSEANLSEAWLFDRWNKRNLVIKEGDLLEVADISARLVKVQQNVLIFERDGNTWELELGHDVRDMKHMATPHTAKSN